MSADGGPAFPRPHSPNPHGGEDDGPWEGMTLRDHFAGQALAGMWAHYFSSEATESDMSLSDMADDCYRMADAMLAERDR